MVTLSRGSEPRYFELQVQPSHIPRPPSRLVTRKLNGNEIDSWITWDAKLREGRTSRDLGMFFLIDPFGIQRFPGYVPWDRVQLQNYLLGFREQLLPAIGFILVKVQKTNDLILVLVNRFLDHI
ncbi:hypothetical protein EUGRSUZ_F04264 [Eucalyptus grandis]|uniref:Uncharacterized protein n=2 Tax=Eucalyptus grandis TaxID=71139 RepID=A0ACC3KPF5_EUCGR|nr:hypothetical protein EUGRSUZ_F04264 [Eucalyptus grandis]